MKLHSKKGATVHSSPGKENVGQRKKRVKKEHKSEKADKPQIAMEKSEGDELESDEVGSD